MFFVISSPAINVCHQSFYTTLKINNKIRPCRNPGHNPVNIIIKSQFIIIQVQPRKDAILFKNIVRYDTFVKKIGTGHILLLLKPACKKRKLRLECVTFAVFIKFWEEWIFFKLLKHKPCSVTLRQQLCKGCLSCPNHPFNRNK